MKVIDKVVPSRKEVESYIELARLKNDGPWIDHSLFAGEAAMRIARYHPELDVDVAYSLGCLHDIGRGEGLSAMHHILSGYNFMNDEGYVDVARICLSHSFPIQDICAYAGEHDCTEEELTYIKHFLKDIEYDEYDRLIQLCDALAQPTGFCIVEKRLVDVSIRHGFNDFTIEKWKGYLNLVKHFSSKIGRSIYECLELDINDL